MNLVVLSVIESSIYQDVFVMLYFEIDNLNRDTCVTHALGLVILEHVIFNEDV